MKAQALLPFLPPIVDRLKSAGKGHSITVSDICDTWPVTMVCDETGARAAAVELKDILDGTASGVAVDVTLGVGTPCGTAAGGTLDGIVAGGVVVNKEVAGTLDGTVFCGVVVDTEAVVAVDTVVGTEAVGALEGTVADGAVRDGTGVDSTPDGMLTDGVLEEDTLAVGGPLTGKFLFLRWYVDHQLLI